MKKMTMIAGAIALAVFSSPAQAGDKHGPAHKNDSHHSAHGQCQYNIDTDFAINNGALTFELDAGSKIVIDELNNLFVDGSQVSLNSEQQVLVASYADGVRNFVPEVANIAIEGLKIGVRASEIALTGIFGADDVVVQDIGFRISELADRIIMRIDPYNFDSRTLEQTIEREFEPEIEAVVKQAHNELTPRLMAKSFTLFASGDQSSMDDFKQRIKELAHNLETEVEAMAADLEMRAEGLCGHIENLNNIETQMASKGLKMMDIIQEGHSSPMFDINKFNIDISE
jgi:hypothetical protein